LAENGESTMAQLNKKAATVATANSRLTYSVWDKRMFEQPEGTWL
jgi:hypothetical protein